nr:MAG: ATPase [Thermoproteus sp. AZ2]
MYFDPRPKERREDLYDREEELRRFVESKSPLVVVTGLRRTGKSSLILVGVKSLGMPYIYIDARAFEEKPYISYADLLKALEEAVNKIRGKGLREALRGLEGVEVYGVSIKFRWGGEGRAKLPEILSALSSWAEDRGEEAIVVIDEAQELIKLRGYNVLPALAYAYDNLRGVRIVLSGSKAGLLARFLRTEDPSSPLYGRYADRIELGPFDKAKAVGFLREGFRQYGVEFDKGEDVYEELGGIPGWLAAFGNAYLRTRDLGKALGDVVGAAVGLIRKEFENFLIGREVAKRRYEAVMRAAKRCATWSEVKRALEAQEGRSINDAEVAKLIRNLADWAFLEKRGEAYCPPDPLIARAF